MNDVAVLGSTGKVLMPTSRARARILVKKGRAVIRQYRPVFTIQLLDREDGAVQPVELAVDTGYGHIGSSVCSEKHEYLGMQHDLLPDEPERHRDRAQYRRQRRNRLRHRMPRFSNRKGMICKDGFAPSIRNKRDRHIDLVLGICEVVPVTEVTLELGSFDTQLLKALELGLAAPEGTDYQHGERYGIETFREAVFLRDGYTCQCCGRSPFAKEASRHAAYLRVHHAGYWKGDHTDRMGNLLTVCEKCHTSKNHQPGGLLYGLDPKLKPLKEATFMTMVRKDMLQKLREALPGIRIRVTYGAATKAARRELGLPKSHTNDAYAMGQYHPKHRARTVVFKKRRRNNRIMERFYDAKYVDRRTGEVKKASALGCNRTGRSMPRDNGGNELGFRGRKTSAGYRSIRKGRHCFQAGDIIRYGGRIMTVRTARFKQDRTGNVFETVEPVQTGKQVHAGKVELVRFAPVWQVEQQS